MVVVSYSSSSRFWHRTVSDTQLGKQKVKKVKMVLICQRFEILHLRREGRSETRLIFAPLLPIQNYAAAAAAVKIWIWETADWGNEITAVVAIRQRGIVEESGKAVKDNTTEKLAPWSFSYLTGCMRIRKAMNTFRQGHACLAIREE